MERIHRLSPLFKNKLKFIVNDGVPACVNCKNLITIDNTPVCRLFGVYDMVHGTTTYLNANKCRAENKLCDTNGIFFSRKDDLRVIENKLLKHFPYE